MEPEKLMDSLSKELHNSLEAMAKTKDLEEKRKYSEIINNLSQSLGVFLKLASDMMGFDLDEYDEFDED